VKPKIGITISSEVRAEPYAEAVRAAGGEPVVITPEHPVAFDELDGLVLGGGVDVNPELYGEAPHPETEEPNDARDAMERELLRGALDKDVPVLAICRGMQMLNVARGGTLTQHMEGHVMRPDNKGEPAHPVKVREGSVLAGIVGAGTLEVNSRHHQAVARIGEGLGVVAAAADGTVEAVEMRGRRFVVGVQWHPEDMSAVDRLQRELFSRMVASALDLHAQKAQIL